MMLTFFKHDAKGNEPQLFNGEYPYIHWAEPFSTGVIRYKSIYFVADSSTVRVRMDVPEKWNFALYNSKPADSVDIEDKYYIDLKLAATNFVVLEGQAINGNYLYQLNILCRSDVEGEFIETFYINEIPYRVGAEFWGENESLKINLANQGTEIPDFVGKAIYGTNVYDEGVDWVLLNRKFRELLTNHLDILDNKGSYRSLLNALKWFEYDNLVELRDVWKYETPAGTKYYDRPIDLMVNDEIKTRLFNSAKTTYFALRNLKRRIVGHSSMSPIYSETVYNHDPDDNTNVLNKITCKWTEEDMVLKMILLGNFLETYFMPVHTDLIRSVVEDISDFVLTIDFSTGNTEETEVIDTGTFEFGWGDPNDPDKPVIPEDPLAPHIVIMDEVHVYSGIDQPTIIGRAFENDTEMVLDGETIIPMIACHTYDEPNAATAAARLNALVYGLVYNGPGAIETANFSFPEPVVAGKCTSNQWGEFIETNLQPGSSTSEFAVKFLFPRPGSFKLYFEFTGESGTTYTKVASIEVVDNIRVDVQFYKMQSMVASKYMEINPFTAGSDITPMLTIQRNHEYKVANDGSMVTTDIKYTRYIPFRTRNGNAPALAPCLTVVRTLQWKGNNSAAAAKRTAFMESFWAKHHKTEYWLDTGVDTNDIPNPTTWVRICSRRKHAGLWTDWSGLVSMPDVWHDNQVFFPELHELGKIASGEHIDAHYPIICVPEIILDGQNGRRLNYSELTGDPAWEFYSMGLGKDITDIAMPQAISTNIMASSINTSMPRGMYRITFRYNFSGAERTVIKTPDWVLEKDA